MIVSPDAGGAKRVVSIADRLNVNFALIHKEVCFSQIFCVLIAFFSDVSTNCHEIFLSDKQYMHYARRR